MNDFFRNNNNTSKGMDVPKKVKEKNNEILNLIQNCNEIEFSPRNDTKENVINSTYNENYMKHVRKLSQTIQDININDVLMDERVVEGCFRIIKRNIKRSTIAYHSIKPY